MVVMHMVITKSEVADVAVQVYYRLLDCIAILSEETYGDDTTIPAWEGCGRRCGEKLGPRSSIADKHKLEGLPKWKSLIHWLSTQETPTNDLSIYSSWESFTYK